MAGVSEKAVKICIHHLSQYIPKLNKAIGDRAKTEPEFGKWYFQGEHETNLITKIAYDLKVEANKRPHASSVFTEYSDAAVRDVEVWSEKDAIFHWIDFLSKKSIVLARIDAAQLAAGIQEEKKLIVPSSRTIKPLRKHAAPASGSQNTFAVQFPAPAFGPTLAPQFTGQGSMKRASEVSHDPQEKKKARAWDDDMGKDVADEIARQYHDSDQAPAFAPLPSLSSNPQGQTMILQARIDVLEADRAKDSHKHEIKLKEEREIWEKKLEEQRDDFDIVIMEQRQNLEQEHQNLKQEHQKYRQEMQRHIEEQKEHWKKEAETVIEQQKESLKKEAEAVIQQKEEFWKKEAEAFMHRARHDEAQFQQQLSAAKQLLEDSEAERSRLFEEAKNFKDRFDASQEALKEAEEKSRSAFSQEEAQWQQKLSAAKQQLEDSEAERSRLFEEVKNFKDLLDASQENLEKAEEKSRSASSQEEAQWQQKLSAVKQQLEESEAERSLLYREVEDSKRLLKESQEALEEAQKNVAPAPVVAAPAVSAPSVFSQGTQTEIPVSVPAVCSQGTQTEIPVSVPSVCSQSTQTETPVSVPAVSSPITVIKSEYPAAPSLPPTVPTPPAPVAPASDLVSPRPFPHASILKKIKTRPAVLRPKGKYQVPTYEYDSLPGEVDRVLRAMAPSSLPLATRLVAILTFLTWNEAARVAPYGPLLEASADVAANVKEVLACEEWMDEKVLHELDVQIAAVQAATSAYEACHWDFWAQPQCTLDTVPLPDKSHIVYGMPVSSKVGFAAQHLEDLKESFTVLAEEFDLGPIYFDEENPFLGFLGREYGRCKERLAKYDVEKLRRRVLVPGRPFGGRRQMSVMGLEPAFRAAGRDSLAVKKSVRFAEEPPRPVPAAPTPPPAPAVPRAPTPPMVPASDTAQPALRFAFCAVGVMAILGGLSSIFG
ncbi:hypothetical protein DM02DRAFT_635541 [Periconia macrospinosa]|uniref:Uncharacterized protein n=1 Tax=Periconia macrospinosa TaxID=97972 RepID=A0A2V1D2C9_9PLEO|nr:hypothetical protein DM02DRAFT_635541 [Periconia macrospinosa]